MKTCTLVMSCFVFRVTPSAFISLIRDAKSVTGFKFDCLICSCVFVLLISFISLMEWINTIRSNVEVLFLQHASVFKLFNV